MTKNRTNKNVDIDTAEHLLFELDLIRLESEVKRTSFKAILTMDPIPIPPARFPYLLEMWSGKAGLYAPSPTLVNRIVHKSEDIAFPRTSQVVGKIEKIGDENLTFGRMNVNLLLSKW